MISPALDASYEACCGAVEWRTVYDWTAHAYRRMKLQRLEWGRCVDGAAPDAALAPAPLPKGRAAPGHGRGGYRPQGPPAMKAARLAKGAATDAQLVEALRAHGPSTLAQLSAATGLNRAYIGERLRRSPQVFREVGSICRAAIWAVVEA